MTKGNKERLSKAGAEIDDLLKNPRDTQHVSLRILMLIDHLSVILNDLILRPGVNELDFK